MTRAQAIAKLDEQLDAMYLKFIADLQAAVARGELDEGDAVATISNTELFAEQRRDAITLLDRLLDGTMN